MKLIREHFLVYFCTYVIVFLLGYAIFRRVNVLLFLLPFVFIVLTFYLEEVRYPKVLEKRRAKMNALLCKKYGKGKEIEGDKILFYIQNRKIVFKFWASTSVRNSLIVNNYLHFYISIEDQQEAIKKLCSIHFCCTKIKGELYVDGKVPSSLFLNCLVLI